MKISRKDILLRLCEKPFAPLREIKNIFRATKYLNETYLLPGQYLQ